MGNRHCHQRIVRQLQDIAAPALCDVFLSWHTTAGLFDTVRHMLGFRCSRGTSHLCMAACIRARSSGEPTPDGSGLRTGRLWECGWEGCGHGEGGGQEGDVLFGGCGRWTLALWTAPFRRGSASSVSAPTVSQLGCKGLCPTSPVRENWNQIRGPSQVMTINGRGQRGCKQFMRRSRGGRRVGIA